MFLQHEQSPKRKSTLMVGEMGGAVQRPTSPFLHLFRLWVSPSPTMHAPPVPVARAGHREEKYSVYLPERSTMQSDGRVR